MAKSCFDQISFSIKQIKEQKLQKNIEIQKFLKVKLFPGYNNNKNK